MIGKLIRVARHPLGWIRWKYETSGRKHLCYICGRTLRRFRPYGNGSQSVSAFTRELQVIGSDVENFSCPLCGCHDRERHLVMYFDRLSLWGKVKGGDVLRFAPERHFSARIERQRPTTYIKADLFPSSPDIQQIDATRIPFGDEHFDVIICNHVLEHIPDDRKVLSELFRVLRPGGFAVLQTPYSSLLENSFCDSSVNSDELRARFYGQEDHVRVYGRDLFRRIQEAGFELCVRRHADVLSDIEPSFYGVNARENLILGTKGLQEGLP